MKKVIMIFSLLIYSGISLASVGNKDLDEIRDLASDGQFQEALEKHLWFHEESKSSASMAGVRLSYAISAWVELGEKYPPAKEALTRVKEKDQETLLSGSGNFQNFHDLYAINLALGEDEATLELFLILDKKYPEQSSLYYIVAEDLLIEHKKYDICAKYLGDPILKYEELRHRREMELSFAKMDAEINDTRYLEDADKRFVDGVLSLIEVLIAISKREDALEVQKRALSYIPDKSINDAI